MSNLESGPVDQDGITRSVIDDLPVSVEAVLGITDVTVGALTRLKSGDTFSLDSRLGDPVQLRVNGTIVAYGELVAVADNFAVRIHQIARE